MKDVNYVMNQLDFPNYHLSVVFDFCNKKGKKVEKRGTGVGFINKQTNGASNDCLLMLINIE